MRIPQYPKVAHASGQARIKWQGKTYYLGVWKSPESRAELRRIVHQITGGNSPKRGEVSSVNRVATLYLAYIESRYDKTRVGHTKRFMGMMLPYGRGPANEFDSFALEALQQQFVDEGWYRSYCNDQLRRVKQMFKWAAGRRLVDRDLPGLLSVVEPLKLGYTDAPERPPVRPVDDATIEATLPHLPTVVRAMVNVHRIIGTRPQNIVWMRGDEIDRSKPEWLYTPLKHKNAHRKHALTIAIGQRAQRIIAPYLARYGDGYLFPPEEATNESRARQSRSGVTFRFADNPAKCPGEHYTSRSYCHAIHDAIEDANKLIAAANATLPEESRRPPLKLWSPNRIRHARATEIRALYGLEAAQVALGHSSMNSTLIYAEKSIEVSNRIAREIG